jgi:two-component system chemotaxis sensor kinase CheA
MDAVRTKVAELNGRVEIQSERNKGSAFVISVPLTLAILPTLMVKVSEQRFALPLTSVKEVCELELSAIHTVNGQRVMIIREQPMPLHRANEYLRLPLTERDEEAPPEVVVVLELEARRVGFVVDEILGQEEAVLKPLGAYVRDLPGLGGGTVTGDGGIALILDVGDLLRKATPLRSPATLSAPASAPHPEAVCEA